MKKKKRVMKYLTKHPGSISQNLYIEFPFINKNTLRSYLKYFKDRYSIITIDDLRVLIDLMMKMIKYIPKKMEPTEQEDQVIGKIFNIIRSIDEEQ